MTSTTPKYRDFPLSLLCEDPKNARRYMNKELLQALGRSLLRDGQQNPIMVVQLSEQPESYQIVQGHRRYRAGKMFNIPSLFGMLLPDRGDPSTLTRKALCEDLFREQLTPFELATLFQKEMTECGLTARELAREIAISESQVSKALSCAKKIVPEARALIEQHGLEPKGVYYLSRLSPTDQLEVIHSATCEKRWSAEMLIEEVKRRLGSVRSKPQKCSIPISKEVCLTLFGDVSLETVQKELACLQKKLRRYAPDNLTMEQLAEKLSLPS